MGRSITETIAYLGYKLEIAGSMLNSRCLRPNNDIATA